MIKDVGKLLRLLLQASPKFKHYLIGLLYIEIYMYIYILGRGLRYRAVMISKYLLKKTEDLKKIYKFV